ncbi:MAG: asparagine synthase (glutamine-hydrolyzing), partial [Nitrososphaerales archaeon]
MCGIVGTFDYATVEGNATRRVIESMSETLHHRGPDGEGVFISGDRRIGLGMRRLAIIDPRHGTQPMFGANGECLIFNGEIYNYPRLRRNLEAEGVAFRTHCDTEVILHLYRHYGTSLVERLDGMFAFALWDPREQELLIARDRLGEKPLYWCDVGGCLIFASEPKALLKHPATTASVNAAAIPSYLANLVVPSPDTLYEGIQKLPAGNILRCSTKGVRTTSYWSPSAFRTLSSCSFEEATNEVRRLLDDSVQERLMSDVPVGVLLSGGVDSTTLVALLREKANGLATFSVGFDGEPELDERDEARWVAQHFGTAHHEVTLSQEEA